MPSSYLVELSRCRRFLRLVYPNYLTAYSVLSSSGYCNDTTHASMWFTSDDMYWPAGGATGTLIGTSNINAKTVSAITVGRTSIYCTCATGLVAGAAAFWQASNDITANVIISTEL
jgi:hypothetical protein